MPACNHADAFVIYRCRLVNLLVKNLGFARNEQPIFTDLSFEVLPGKALVLAGANGAGKTTLLKILAGLIQPDQGEISYVNQSLQPDLVAWLGVKNSLKLDWTALQNLEFLLSLRAGSAVQFQQDDYLTALHRFDLFAQRHQQVKKFSSGMQRRLALAALSLTQAKIWLLDEPQTALDKAGVAKFEQLLSEHLANSGLAVIASHQEIQNCPNQVLQLGAK